MVYQSWLHPKPNRSWNFVDGGHFDVFQTLAWIFFFFGRDCFRFQRPTCVKQCFSRRDGNQTEVKEWTGRQEHAFGVSSPPITPRCGRVAAKGQAECSGWCCVIGECFFLNFFFYVLCVCYCARGRCIYSQKSNTLLKTCRQLYLMQHWNLIIDDHKKGCFSTVVGIMFLVSKINACNLQSN